MSEPDEPLWITYEQAIAIHSRQLRRFGGALGLRDEVMLRSALERPVNKWRYERSGMAELAAAHAFELAKNYAFADGNKRMVLNLGEISYIDSGGLGTLVALHTTAHNAGGTIKLANLTRRVGDLLQVTKLLTVFEVHDSEYAALEAFRTAA